MKLVSDMKEFLILNDFTSVNTSMDQSLQKLQSIDDGTNERLASLKDALSADLTDVERQYYISDCKK